MSQKTKTTGQLARENGVPTWKVRRVADPVDIPLPRAGLYRIVTAEAEALILAELQRTGWLTNTADVKCC